jgi:hypothetical protein
MRISPGSPTGQGVPSASVTSTRVRIPPWPTDSGLRIDRSTVGKVTLDEDSVRPYACRSPTPLADHAPISSVVTGLPPVKATVNDDRSAAANSGRPAICS